MPNYAFYQLVCYTVLVEAMWAAIFPHKTRTTVCLGFCFHTSSMYTMLHIPAKIPSVAFDLSPQYKTTTVCLGFCFHTSSMARNLPAAPRRKRSRISLVRRSPGPPPPPLPATRRAAHYRVE